jgi:hypothetical protein
VPSFAFEAVSAEGRESGRRWVFRADGRLPQTGIGGAALKVGDGVDVVLSDGRAALAYGTIAAIGQAGVVVEFSRSIGPGTLAAPAELRLRVDDNQRTIRLRAIERVVRERHALNWVGAVLTESSALPLADAGWDPPADLGLTDGQRRALAGAARCSDLFLIQGPPGTGKTTVISALVRYFVTQRGARVLLSSKGHRPIDNALDRLGSGDLHVVRLGQAGKITGAGQDVLLSDVLAQAEQEVMPRHLSARSGLEDALRSLAVAEDLLVQIDRLNVRIVECDAAIGQRVDQIEAWFASKLEQAPIEVPGGERPGRALEHVLRRMQRLAGRLWRARRQPAGGEPRPAAPTIEAQVAEQRRQQLERQDLVALREHVARLRAEHGQLTARAESLVPSTVLNVSGIAVPRVSVATPDDTRASLSAVVRARRHTEAALPALNEWGTLLQEPGGLADVLVDTADVVAATAIGINSGRDGARTADLEFDVAIVDEAGQAQLIDLVVPLSRARTVILVGDHQQLPPYVDDDLLRRCKEKRIDTTWLEQSVFERLWDRVPDTHRMRLDLQFRMPRVIADFLGRVFYANDLGTVAAKQHSEPVCSLFKSAVVFVDTSAASQRGETALSPGVLNRFEARLVADIAARLPSEYRGGEGLGVIAPYGAQVSAVRQALADALGLAPREPWLLDNVATVDSFQGQERDVILVSLTRSNADGAVGFLSDLKRLNVTLSRARAQLVIIGDLSTLCASGGGPERRAFARFARDLADHVRQHSELLEVEELQRRLEL